MCVILNTKEKALVDSITGDILRPSCFDDLVAYHSYLIGIGKSKEAKTLLKDVFKGEKIISNMVEALQKIHTKE